MTETKNRPTTTIMAHMIPFFPDEAGSFEVVEGLVEAGIRYLEIQFPFTDPTADGPVIEAACTRALANGFTVDKGFAFVKSVSDLCHNAGVDIFIMTYGSLVFTKGVESFVLAAKAAGAQGLIVPDLPPDSDEGLYALCHKHGLTGIPVIVPTISAARLNMVRELKANFVYCALRAGITGNQTKLDSQLLNFLETLHKEGCQVMGGFGIQVPAQVAVLREHVHAVVVGSAIMRTIQAWVAAGRSGNAQTLQAAVTAFVGSLVRA